MDIRRLPATQGWVWFRQAIDLGSKNPRAVFGAALLSIAALYAALLLMVLVLASLMFGGKAAGKTPDLGMVMLVALPLALAIMLLVPMLLGGLMHVIREGEAGRPVRARDVFSPLRARQGRRLAWLGVVQVVLAILGGAVMMTLAGGDYWRDYLQAMQSAMQGAQPTMPEPQHPGLLFLVQMAFNYFSYALMLFSIPLMLFSGCSLDVALRAAWQASLRNIGANLLAGVVFLAAMMVAAFVVLLLAGLLGMVGGLIHAAVGSALVMLVMLGFAAVVLVLLAGASYLAWRDTFGDTALPPALPGMHGFEA
ncbi:MAG: DUF2189 domain-containing protein [Xanthomonadaceae bacterium]|nr:DUF2189 domain-containing protein [Xanthomonadaceae bacterium]